MGGIFFRRRSAPRLEVINDRSGDVSTFFRVLQRHYLPFVEMLRWQLTVRAEFERLVAMCEFFKFWHQVSLNAGTLRVTHGDAVAAAGGGAS